MDLSPNDIRSYEFPNQMRGYDKDEVDNFLEQVATAMEAVKQENLKMSMEVDSLKSQLAGLRQFEETIKNAAIDARRNADSTMSKAKEEAAEILANAKKQAEDMIGSRERRVTDIQNQLRQLELTRKSYINRFRSLVESHQDIVSEIEQQEFPEVPTNLAPPEEEPTPAPTPKPSVPRDQLEVTESSELSGERKEALHQAPSNAEPTKTEEANAPDPVAVNEADSGALDPELAAALKSYQTEYGDARPKTEKSDDEVTAPPHVPTSDLSKWHETTNYAEDIPAGFVAGPAPRQATPADVPEVDEAGETGESEEDQTNKTAIGGDSQEHPTEHNTIDIDSEQKPQPQQQQPQPPRAAQQAGPGANIAKELDEIVEKFEEEMDKAEKG